MKHGSHDLAVKSHSLLRGLNGVQRYCNFLGIATAKIHVAS